MAHEMHMRMMHGMEAQMEAMVQQLAVLRRLLDEEQTPELPAPIGHGDRVDTHALLSRLVDELLVYTVQVEGRVSGQLTLDL